jgi:hypothetical protein
MMSTASSDHGWNSYLSNLQTDVIRRQPGEASSRFVLWWMMILPGLIYSIGDGSRATRVAVTAAAHLSSQWFTSRKFHDNAAGQTKAQRHAPLEECRMSKHASSSRLKAVPPLQEYTIIVCYPNGRGERGVIEDTVKGSCRRPAARLGAPARAYHRTSHQGGRRGKPQELRSSRELAGHSQRAAERLGVHYRSWQSWVAGRNPCLRSGSCHRHLAGIERIPSAA